MICKRIIRGALFSRNHCRNGGSCRAPGTTVGSCVQARSLSTLFVEKELYNQFTIVEKRGITDGTELDAILDEMRATGDVYTRSEDLAKAVEEATYDTLDMRKRALMNEDDLRPYEALVAAHHTSLFARQLHMEQEQQSDAVEEYNESLKQLIVMGRGTGLKYVQRVLLRWYEPLTRVIDAEMSLIEARTSGQDRLVRQAESILYITVVFVAPACFDHVSSSCSERTHAEVVFNIFLFFVTIRLGF